MKEAYIRAALKTRWLGSQVICFDEIDSTNEEVKRRAETGAGEGLLITAERQSRGKGRRGRSWDSLSGENIAMSFLLRPDFSPDIAPRLTLVMAMAAASGIGEITELPVQIKWPNDIVLRGKKITGILTEMTADKGLIREVVVGTGINVNTQAFPDELREKATSLYLESGTKWERTDLIASILLYFEKYYEIFQKTGTFIALKDDYNRICVNAGKQVCVLDPKGSYEALAEGINDNGELLVRKADGTSCGIYSGEVSVRGVYGYV